MVKYSVETLSDTLFLLLRRNDQTTRDVATKILDIHVKALNNNQLLNQDAFDFYTMLIREVLDSNISLSDKASMEALIVRIKNNKAVQNDPEILRSIQSMMTAEVNEDSIEFSYQKLCRWLMLEHNDKAVRQMFGIMSKPTDNSVSAQENTLAKLNEAYENILQYNNDYFNKLKGKAEEHLAREMDSNDEESLIKAMEVLTTNTKKNRFITGLQGLNKAMDGGIDLGESLVINSRAHNGKSMMLLKLARWIITLNKVDESFVNPTCIFYSMENEVPQNMKAMFNELWINDKKEVPPADISNADIVKYCIKRFKECGWRLIMRRKVGQDFGFNELVMEFKEIVRLGYTPLVCIIDYVNMMRKDGNDKQGNYLQVRMLYTNLCNFLKSNNCCLITAHQLNRKADEMVRMNPCGAVKKFSADMLADSTDPQREVDMVIYQNKELDTTDRPWMTFKLDKHRYHENTSEKDKFFAYRFEGELGIMDDINSENKSVTNIYAAGDDDEEDDSDITKPSFS